MRVAADMPLGHVPSAVMFQATLRAGMTMLQVVGKTKTLGRKADDGEDDWLWRDDGGGQRAPAFRARPPRALATAAA